ncbi:hypothetical protein PRIC1_009882 [Phytophthora ramorum]
MKASQPTQLHCELTVKAGRPLERCRDNGVALSFAINVVEGYGVLRAKVKSAFATKERPCWNDSLDIYIKLAKNAQKAFVKLDQEGFISFVRTAWRNARLRRGGHFVSQRDQICRDELQKLEDFLPQYTHQFWSCAVKKGYASTAIFSKTKPLSVKDEIVLGVHESKGATKEDNGGKDQEGRFLALEFPQFWLVHTYVPNAGGKLQRLDFRTNQWDKAMLREMKEMEKTKPVIWCGDLNVADQEIDIHNPKGNRKSAGFTDQERESFGEILDSGYVDTFRRLHPDKVEYSYFGYRNNMRAKNKGWRLDYFVVSEALMPKVRSSYIRSSVIGSDHLPVGLELGGL